MLAGPNWIPPARDLIWFSVNGPDQNLAPTCFFVVAVRFGPDPEGTERRSRRGLFFPSSPVRRKFGSWCPGPPPCPASWWSCWTCCWGRRSRSCPCTFCAVCSWTRSHRLAARRGGGGVRLHFSWNGAFKSAACDLDLPLVCWSLLLLSPSITTNHVLTASRAFWHKTEQKEWKNKYVIQIYPPQKCW